MKTTPASPNTWDAETHDQKFNSRHPVDQCITHSNKTYLRIVISLMKYVVVYLMQSYCYLCS